MLNTLLLLSRIAVRTALAAILLLWIVASAKSVSASRVIAENLVGIRASQDTVEVSRFESVGAAMSHMTRCTPVPPNIDLPGVCITWHSDDYVVISASFWLLCLCFGSLIIGTDRRITKRAQFLVVFRSAFARKSP